MAPDAHDPNVKVGTMMTTADMALLHDPEYNAISKDFHQNPEKLADEFARAWFKLLHRDMGPKTRYMGPEVPEEELIWQDPIPKGKSFDIDNAKSRILKSGLTNKEMIETAWCSAFSFRESDLRGGANGARIALEPQISWESNKPDQLANKLDENKCKKIIEYSKKVLLEAIKKGGSSIRDFKNISGKEGAFQKIFKVYDREGLKCKKIKCKGVIQKKMISNRSTFFCNSCQK